MNVKIYYGLSGAMKGSTIKSEKQRAPDKVDIMESAIKPWKYYHFGLFNGLIEYNDLNFCILHLVRLRDFIERNHNSGKDLVVERGVTDFLFYYYNNVTGLGKTRGVDEDFITGVVGAENTNLLPDFSTVEKVLFIQKDKDFVRDVVMKDSVRRKTFHGDIDYYFSLQDKYVDFTTKYNVINRVIEIDNAKDYITKVLGEKWETNNNSF